MYQEYKRDPTHSGHTQSDTEADDMEYLPEYIQRRIESQEAMLGMIWEERKAAAASAGIRRVPRRPSIYTYCQGQGQGIHPSLTRQYYAPNGMDTSSRKKKSGQGITIHKNKQSASIAGSSGSHLNRTERVAILMCITLILHLIVPRHPI